LTDESKYTVPIGLAQLQNESTYRVEYGGLFAGLVIAIIPILIVYACFQKQLQEGVKAQGGVKG
jgi:N-acetylglucosamine transport system permease protein